MVGDSAEGKVPGPGTEPISLGWVDGVVESAICGFLRSESHLIWLVSTAFHLIWCFKILINLSLYYRPLRVGEGGRTR